MSKKCCVCGEVKDTTENVLFKCQGHGCDVIVHQACYGIVTVPSGLWFCRKCESQERAARVRCELCPKKEGALKRTDCGGWAHIICALYIPEVTFGNNERMEPIVTSKLPRERFSKPCYICEERGLETQAVHGACMSCHKSSCRMAFHVTCAQREHLLCEEEDQRDPRNLIYCGYCATHFRKIARQKYLYKQSLRKPLANTPTSTVPPLPSPLSLSDHSHSSPPSQSTPLLVTPHPYTLSSLTPSHVEPINREDKVYTHLIPPGKVKKEKLPLNEHPSHKRLSLDSPIPPLKKRRRRKVSSSNESTTSEAHSISSDLHGLHVPHAGVIPHIPILPVEHMDTSKVGHVGGRVEGDVDGQGMSLSPVTSAQVGLSVSGGGAGIDVMGVARQPSSSTSSEQSLASRSQMAPPRSLQELLERQWEQTAQFILDQVGKQNNVGSMLAHLHTLQSENRQMQSKIMELASQREFYIAINTKLRQTIAEQEVGRLPNGVREEQPTASPEATVETTQVSKPKSTSTKRVVNSKSRSKTEAGSLEHHLQSSVQSAPATALSKEVQDSLLKAHFSTTSANSGLFIEQHQDGLNSHAPNTTPKCVANYVYQTSSEHNTTHRRSSTNASSQSRGGRRVYQGRGGAVVPSCVSETRYESGESAHEITRVTNSVQAPITTFTPLPRESDLVVERGGALIRQQINHSSSMYDSHNVR